MNATASAPEVLKELERVAGKISGLASKLDSDRDALVRAAREAGASWTEIGQALGGISRQSAWERYRRVVES